MKKAKIKDIRITILDYITWLLSVVLISYVVCLVVGFFVVGKGNIQAILYVISHKFVLVGTIIVSIVGYIPFAMVMYWQFERSYVIRRLKSMRTAIDGNLENSHFITTQEMRQAGYRMYKALDELKQAEDGILLHLEDTRKGVKAIIAPSAIHALVLGTTGSGKTTSYIIPSIKALAITQTKPSFLITDPKGELSEQLAWYLEENGYSVKILDFRHPERSTRWNPLSPVYDKYQAAQQLSESVTYRDGIYFFKGKKYSVEDIESAVLVEEQRLEDEAYEEVKEIVSGFCPVNPREPIWDEGAKSLIEAVTLAMLEDTADVSNPLSKKQFCFYNVAKIAQKNR